MAEPWPTGFAEARQVQEMLAPRVRPTGDLPRLQRIAGVDVHYAPARGLALAAAVVLDATSLEIVESAMAAVPVAFPYVPGYLSFREAPAALAALALLEHRPDLLLVDGQGLAHPRGFGLACHVGLLADLPTIGVAKSRLVGTHAEPAGPVGSQATLQHRGQVIGAVVRTRMKVRPLYVSVGHRLGLEVAVGAVLALGRGYRLPEPTRLADRLSRAHAP